MEHTSLNSAQVAATAFLHALGPVWVNRHVKWLDIHPHDSGQEPESSKMYLRVTVQISASRLRGMVVLCRETSNDPWSLSEMESYIGYTGPLKQGVRFGHCKETRQIKTQNVEG